MFGTVLSAPASSAAGAAAAAALFVAGYFRHNGDRYLEGLNLGAGDRVACRPPVVLR